MIGRRRHRSQLFLFCVAASLPALASGAEDAAPAVRPNIVLIIVDTLRADRLGAYGYPAPTSPELDSYARRGVRFERVIAQTTWTRPSIGSLLTSQYPRTLGLTREEGHTVAPRFAMLAELLKAEGYSTFGATANANLNSDFGFAQGFDRYIDSEILFPFMPGAAEQKASGRRMVLPRARDLLLDALSQIRRLGGRPHFVQIILMDVHEYRTIREPIGERYDALADPDLMPDDLRYLKSIRYTSREIDLFVQSLLGLPGWDNSLVIITSDHGETLAADHRSLADPKWHGYLVYPTQVLVPWIMFSTSGGIPEGFVVERPVRLLDLLPTILDYASIPVPDGLAGVSLMPLLDGRAGSAALPERMVVETLFRGSDKTAVYSDAWVYVENRDHHEGTTPRELQRLEAPMDGAATNVIAGRAEVAQSLADYLARWREEHPQSEPTLSDDGPSEQTEEQLRALGYID